MALNSINTNLSAMTALSNLMSTQSQLATTQNTISTGKKINTAKDNGAVWSIANTMNGKVSSLDSVKDSLNRAQSTIDVAMSAGQQVSDLLTQMKAKALAAADTSLDTTSRTALNEDFKSLRDQISKVVTNADFNGINMVKSGGTTLNALASHLKFVGSLQNSLTTGISNLVDADMAAESAKLQALQTKQQLGVQTLSIANQSTSIMLSLFR